MEKEVYKGQIIRVTEETIGNTVWERAYMPDGVIIFPITDDGKILLIKEMRPHENPNIRIKAVSGILEHDKGTPAENAQREMQEEIGLKATTLTPLMTLKGTGTINSTQHFFMARGMVPSKLPNPDGEDSILDIVPFTPNELLDALMQDRIRWSTTALGIFRLLEVLKREM
ncbi:MAG TPA: NUDIX hydrolase [Bacteriovoracaceae bacterium]|nr:NUDIX hydrolase [Bacteriovoracaceae bacterium]